MRFKLFPLLLLITLLSSVFVFAQSQDEDVRGAFLSTRVTVSAGSSETRTSTRRSSRRRSSSASSSSNRRQTSTTTSAGASVGLVNSSTGNTRVHAAASNAPIGLGYSFFIRDQGGQPVRVDPAREFHAGDRIRLSFETNVDGYLYVFHTENGGTPEMIYPDAQLDDGHNEVDAHVPYEIPWSPEEDERFHWFVFDNRPATERLYIVVTRDPLPGVPTADALVNYCHSNRCPWQPLPQVWAQVKAGAEGRISESKATVYGQAQTSGEREATTRGMGLDRSAPPPSVVRMNVTSNAPVLVTAIDLIHR